MSTPNIIIYQDKEINVKVGKFYRSGNQDTYIGAKVEVGSAGIRTVLYPVDRSQVPSGFTITYLPPGSLSKE